MEGGGEIEEVLRGEEVEDVFQGGEEDKRCTGEEIRIMKAKLNFILIFFNFQFCSFKHTISRTSVCQGLN